jgi:hypothetical protein
MATEDEVGRGRQAAPALDDEREIDFGRLGRAILARWWLVLAAVVIGAVLGYATSRGSGEVYVARTTVYLGQPLSPTGGSQIQGLATNPATVGEIVKSQDLVQSVADEVGVQPGKLRRGISTRAIFVADPAKRLPQNPLMEISVRGPWRDESAEAADLLAAAVIESTSGYVDEKAKALGDQLTAQDEELDSIDSRLDELQQAAEAPGISAAERAGLLGLIGFAEQRRGQLVEERTTTRQLLTLANTVERGKQVTKARAVKVPAQSPRSAVAVGALIGLFAGLLLALLWDPLARRVRPKTA